MHSRTLLSSGESIQQNKLNEYTEKNVQQVGNVSCNRIPDNTCDKEKSRVDRVTNHYIENVFRAIKSQTGKAGRGLLNQFA